MSYAGEWVTRSVRRRGGAGIFDGLDAVFEFDAFTEINRLILSMVSAQQRAAPPEPCGFESYYPP